MRQVELFGRKVDAIVIIAVVTIIAGLAFYAYTGLSPKQGKPSGELEQQIAERIKAGISVDSKEDARDSIASISQELENLRGAVSKANNGLEGKPSTGPTGLVFFAQVAITLAILASLAALLFHFAVTRGKNLK
ncbi:MAG: hypothetical protein HY392_02930 [Candidatus Diapherotrites archaeon]|nr:hypothetical protein [Candidatus Diapherotrites archaeon]